MSMTDAAGSKFPWLCLLWSPIHRQCSKICQNTYNSGYSLVVTHLTTNPPVRCLNRAERTGSLVFNVLWSYVEDKVYLTIIILRTCESSCEILSLCVCLKRNNLCSVQLALMPQVAGVN